MWVSPLRTKPVGDGTQERHIQCSGEHGGEGQEGVGGGDQGQVQGGRQGGEQVHLRDLHLRVSFSTLIASHNCFISQEGVFPPRYRTLGP